MMPLPPKLSSTLAGLDQSTDETTLIGLVAEVSANTKNPDVKALLKDLIAKEGEKVDCAINVLTAGLFGILPGGESLLPGGLGRVELNRFLHALRLGILESPSPLMKRDINNLFNFYPEFVTWCGDNIRGRIVHLARAHAGFDSKNGKRELEALYSLGGYFSEKTADPTQRPSSWTGVLAVGGTTCVMTARAVYHAAGASMVFEKKKTTLNTPLGASAVLDLPHSGPPIPRGQPKPVRTDYSQFDEDVEFDKEGAPNPPGMKEGDIFLLKGDEDRSFFNRGGSVDAGHVGVVVSRWSVQRTPGDKGPGHRWFIMMDTVDGGQTGSDTKGSKVEYRQGRKLYFKPNVGWTFEAESKRSFNTSELNIINSKLKVQQEEALQKIAAGEAGYKTHKATLDKILADEATATQLGDQKKLAEVAGRKRSLWLTATSSLREQALNDANAGSTKLGEVRTLQGWWSPEPFPGLKVTDRSAIQALVDAL